MKKLFFIIIFISGFYLYADPAIQFSELMNWFGKTGNDIINAGGQLTSENDLRAAGLGILRTYVMNYGGGNSSVGFVFSDARLTDINFWSRVQYSSRREFERDVESIEYLVQSLNGRLTYNRNWGTDNEKRYVIILDRAFEITISVFANNASDGFSSQDPRNVPRFGQYNITIKSNL